MLKMSENTLEVILQPFSKTMTVPYPFNSKNIKDPSQRPEFQSDIRDVHPFLESKNNSILIGNNLTKELD